ncbi:MAG: 4-hydroxy-3-methylbut-2-enyl diphosphate reductase [Planctomycetota bacterium]|jgi:4-hydroxy-3-methylbut-2-enyl diphosphate reductase
MNVLCAEPMGVCTGVRRALAVAEQIDCPESVTIHGQLVHNELVQARLESRGFQISAEEDRARLPQTSDVLITAHGISDSRRRGLQAAGKRLIDTTCPLVRRVHRVAQQLQAEGYHVLLIGRPGHVEVLGIVEDLASYDVVSNLGDVATYPYDRLGIICQTTVPPREAEQLRLAIRLRNLRAEVRFENTICRATRDRQKAVERLLPRVDVMVVVGGRNSNNTRELVALCRRQGVPAYHVQSAEAINPERFDQYNTVGLTAGTSTLQATIQQVYEALCQIETRCQGGSNNGFGNHTHFRQGQSAPGHADQALHDAATRAATDQCVDTQRASGEDRG